MKILDISRRISPATPVWPGGDRFSRRWTKRWSEHGVNESTIVMNSHTATHVDAPLHFIEDGKALHEIDLKRFIGPAVVLEDSKVETIGSDFLEHAELPSGCKRLLLKTRNSAQIVDDGEFDEHYIALAPSAATWIVECGIELVGIDGFSIQKFQETTNETHRTLLGAGVVILEGLNLSRVAPGRYTLIALPMNIHGAEGGPVRVILTDTGNFN